MTLLRKIGFAAFFALALLVGQQAVVLHDLKHAAEHREGGTPSEKSCDTHYLCAQLGSAATATPPVIPSADAGNAVLAAYFLEGVSQRARLAYRSQAPPQATPA